MSCVSYFTISWFLFQKLNQGGHSYLQLKSSKNHGSFLDNLYETTGVMLNETGGRQKVIIKFDDAVNASSLEGYSTNR